MDLRKKAFIIHIAYLSLKIIIYLAWEAQIIFLIIKKIDILAKYLDYANVFLEKSAVELPKHCNINKYFMNLKLDK